MAEVEEFSTTMKEDYVPTSEDSDEDADAYSVFSFDADVWNDDEQDIADTGSSGEINKVKATIADVCSDDEQGIADMRSSCKTKEVKATIVDVRSDDKQVIAVMGSSCDINEVNPAIADVCSDDRQDSAGMGSPEINKVATTIPSSISLLCEAPPSPSAHTSFETPQKLRRGTKRKNNCFANKMSTADKLFGS